MPELQKSVLSKEAYQIAKTVVDEAIEPPVQWWNENKEAKMGTKKSGNADKVARRVKLGDNLKGRLALVAAVIGLLAALLAIVAALGYAGRIMGDVETRAAGNSYPCGTSAEDYNAPRPCRYSNGVMRGDCGDNPLVELTKPERHIKGCLDCACWLMDTTLSCVSKTTPFHVEGEDCEVPEASAERRRLQPPVPSVHIAGYTIGTQKRYFQTLIQPEDPNNVINISGAAWIGEGILEYDPVAAEARVGDDFNRRNESLIVVSPTVSGPFFGASYQWMPDWYDSVNGIANKDISVTISVPGGHIDMSRAEYNCYQPIQGLLSTLGVQGIADAIFTYTGRRCEQVAPACSPGNTDEAALIVCRATVHNWGTVRAQALRVVAIVYGND